MDGAAGQRPRLVFAIVVLATLAAGMLALPQPASADHGYQTYGFTNKTDKKVPRALLIFDREISHVEEHTWDGAECIVTGPENKYVKCEGGKPRRENDGFVISVATPPPAAPPPPYAEAELEHWFWQKGNQPVMGENQKPRNYKDCKRSAGCKYLGTTVPARPSGGPWADA